MVIVPEECHTLQGKVVKDDALQEMLSGEVCKKCLQERSC